MYKSRSYLRVFTKVIPLKKFCTLFFVAERHFANRAPIVTHDAARRNYPFLTQPTQLAFLSGVANLKCSRSHEIASTTRLRPSENTIRYFFYFFVFCIRRESTAAGLLRLRINGRNIGRYVVSISRFFLACG